MMAMCLASDVFKVPNIGRFLCNFNDYLRAGELRSYDTSNAILSYPIIQM